MRSRFNAQICSKSMQSAWPCRWESCTIVTALGTLSRRKVLPCTCAHLQAPQNTGTASIVGSSAVRGGSEELRAHTYNDLERSAIFAAWNRTAIAWARRSHSALEVLLHAGRRRSRKSRTMQ